MTSPHPNPTRFRAAFLLLVLGSTLVVDDLTVARRIGIGLVRMVTLDGDLAETSGAMHGGFRQKAKGLGFQEKETSEHIRRAEEKVQENQLNLE